MVSDKLKQVIFKKLYNDLKGVEIIPYEDSIYFIDKENKYWFFEYEKSGKLWWRYDFFETFFLIFSLNLKDYQSILGEWVEEVLNCKVLTTRGHQEVELSLVEEVLNCKVLTTLSGNVVRGASVEEVLNCKVLTTPFQVSPMISKVEEVLNCKVLTTSDARTYATGGVEEVLSGTILTNPIKVEQVLNANHLIHWNNSVLRLGNNLED